MERFSCLQYSTLKKSHCHHKCVLRPVQAHVHLLTKENILQDWHVDAHGHCVTEDSQELDTTPCPQTCMYIEWHTIQK